MAKKRIITSKITLIGLLCDMESDRKNGKSNHKLSKYADGLYYNLILNEDKYEVEVMNEKSGEDHVRENYEFPINFEAELSITTE